MMSTFAVIYPVMKHSKTSKNISTSVFTVIQDTLTTEAKRLFGKLFF